MSEEQKEEFLKDIEDKILAEVKSRTEDDLIRALQTATLNIVHSECFKRCPDNRGHEKKCGFCDVQRVFHLFATWFKLYAPEIGSYNALRWIVEEEHKKPAGQF